MGNKVDKPNIHEIDKCIVGVVNGWHKVKSVRRRLYTLFIYMLATQ